MKPVLLLLSSILGLSACMSTAKTLQNMDVYALRLHPGQDLKKELDAFAREHHLQAGFVITCVGSLRRVTIRPAGQQQPLLRSQKFEIVSLVGTLSPDGSHLHIALSDSNGATLGGHLLEGNEIYTTAEIVIGEAQHLQFRRTVDPATTFKELTVNKRE
ncbi:MAG: PPC domain-containing DNA-binding protein [Saprospiraceae bacterium]